MKPDIIRMKSDTRYLQTKIRELQNKKTGWKVVAIIFLILFVAESSFWIWAINWGYEHNRKESLCSLECSQYTLYRYEEEICSCLNINNYGDVEAVKSFTIE